ncbi:hypothetical protein MUP35_00625 [Patescibacteria group bacterium]|nr:hypothetical protein [Patescibacteria group bacterium]
MVEEQISVINPLGILNKINKKFLEGKGEVIKQSFDKYLEIFDLSWTERHMVEQSGSHAPHELAIAFYHFIFESDQVVKNVEQLLYSNFKGMTFPGFVIMDGAEVKSLREDWQNLEVKDISSFNPKTSKLFKITGPVEEIKANFEKIKPSFEQTLREVYYNNSAVEK